MIGQVSGGCLERDVQQRAGGVMISKQPILVRYDTGNDAENGTGYSLGCGGTIDILIEPINTPTGRELIQWLRASQSRRCVIATVLSKRNPQIPLGRRMMIDASREPAGSIGDPVLNDSIRKVALDLLNEDRSSRADFPTAGGTVEIFFDLLKPPADLVIFGAGNDALPLVAVGQLLGWRVTVVDTGSASSDASRNWKPDRFVRCRIEDVEQQIRIGSETAAVVMTHNFNHDQKLLRWLATQPLKYLGMLGPRHRTEQLLGDLQPATLRAPVGLDIGAETPEEVALSIAAEISAALRGRSGGSISARPGPIHIRRDT